jgi:hypothetical protein
MPKALQAIAIFLGAMALLLATIKYAPAAEIIVRTVPPPHNDEAVVILQGRIVMGDETKFREQTEKLLSSKVFLFLDSVGGELSSALNIANFVRTNQWTTIVTNGDTCNSACSLIWFSGIHRELGMVAHIGMHSVAVGGDPSKRSAWGNLAVTKYLQAIGMDEALVQRATAADPTNMDYIEYDEAFSLGLLDTKGPSLPSWSWFTKRLLSEAAPHGAWWAPQPIPLAGPTRPVMKIKP